jgi:hypothetical protein
MIAVRRRQVGAAIAVVRYRQNLEGPSFFTISTTNCET